MEDENAALMDHLRSVWSDVAPIPQVDAPDAPVRIAYTPKFTAVMDLFRAVLAADERSERALQLTEFVIGLNAGNYTAWAFRRACVASLGGKWSEELNWVTQLAEDNPKNYQIWQHRRCCLESIGSAGEELTWIEAYLSDDCLEDAKNYHAWAHRQWVVDHFEAWDGELAFCERMLQRDIRNNSAWNHRFFVISHFGWGDHFMSEVEWACNMIALDIESESGWSYVKGCVRRCLGRKDSVTFSGNESDVWMLLNRLVEEVQSSDPENRFMLEMQLFIGQHHNDVAAEAELLSKLASCDSVRKAYWLHLLSQVKKSE